MGRRKSGRSVNGILLLDKAAGISSNSALQRVRRLYDANKAGHTGSLDPLATGVLPVCFGEATKFSQFLLNADKAYRVKARFGLRTDSCDIDGKTIDSFDTSDLTEQQIRVAMQPLTGDIQQIPPMVSALKQDGQRLYKLARQGIEVERPARPVSIKDFRMLEFCSGAEATAVFEVECSKGTYIRSLISDLGDALGCGGTVQKLRRISSGGFAETDCFTEVQLAEQAEKSGAESLDRHLLPMELLMEQFQRVDLAASATDFFMLGQAVMLPEAYRFGAEGDIVRVFREEGGSESSSESTFLGAGELIDDGDLQLKVQPKRLRADI